MKDMSTGSRAARRQQWLERLDSTLGAYGLAAAGQVALQALEDEVEHPTVLNLAASAHYGGGRFEEAARLAAALQKKSPDVRAHQILLARVRRRQELGAPRRP